MGFKKRPAQDEIKVRGFRIEDSADLFSCRALWLELIKWHDELYTNSAVDDDPMGLEFDEHLAKVGAENILVAESQARVVGLIGLVPGHATNTQAELEPIVVASAAQGLGIGHALMAAIFELARARGLRRLLVRPVARNRPALRFFKEAGFATLGQVELFAWLEGPPTWGADGAVLCDINFRV